MTPPRIYSLALSLCLHGLLVLAALYWPSGSGHVISLNESIMDVDIYTIGRPRARGVQAPPKDTPPAAPQTAPQAPPPATPDPPPQVPVPPKVPENVPPPPVAKPEMKPQAPDAPKAPEAIPISANKQDKPKEANATTPVTPVAMPQKTPQKPVQKPEDVLKNALGDFAKTQPAPRSGATAQGGGKPDPKSIDSALGDFVKKGGGGDADAGDGPGGAGGDGIGIVGSYEKSLVSRIRPHWEAPPRSDRVNSLTKVQIHIAPDGTILDVTLMQSSGSPSFDGSVLKAVRDTGKVEAPPTPKLTNVILSFAYEALVAR